MLPDDEDYPEDEDLAADDLDDLNDDDDDDLDNELGADFDDDDDEPKEEISEELYRQAQAAKAMRLFIEDRGRRPYSASELHFFIMSSDVERPIEPEECDIETARKEAEKG